MSEEVKIPGRNEMVRAARKYMGVPFVHLGRTEKGLDCIGLILRVMYDLGVQDLVATNAKDEFDHNWSFYGRRPEGNLLRRMAGQVLVPISIEKALKGDILFFTGDNWVHLGMKTGPDSVIHAYALKPGKVCEHRLSHVWGNRIKCAFSWPFYHGREPCHDLHEER